jgi:hypothetical protein
MGIQIVEARDHPGTAQIDQDDALIVSSAASLCPLRG